MKVLSVSPGRSPEMIEIDGSLQSMQKLVGGLIQAIYPYDDPVALICNDEGKMAGLEYNRALRDLDTGKVYDIIAGPFFICGFDQDRFSSLPEQLVKKYMSVFLVPEFFLKIGSQLLIIQG